MSRLHESDSPRTEYSRMKSDKPATFSFSLTGLQSPSKAKILFKGRTRNVLHARCLRHGGGFAIFVAHNASMLILHVVARSSAMFIAQFVFAQFLHVKCGSCND